MPTPEKEKLADFVVDNSGRPEETRQQVLGILSKLK
jgi:dephospho-CoA kinase